MKRYIYRNLFVLAALSLATACSEKETTDQEILDGRESLKLEVSYVYSGAEVNSLSFSHSPIRTVLDVSLNNENLKWNLESDSPWCTVIQQEHRGAGPITLEIAANEAFEAREPATLTFVAGAYRGFQITVSQSASAFIISQPFFIAPKEGGSYSVEVQSPSGTEWSFSGAEWLTVAKGETVTANGLSTTQLTITPAANTGDSRYGSVTLTRGSEKDNISFYQFGKDFEYQGDSIFIPGNGETGISFTVPSYIVKEVITNAFTHAEISDNGDGTATVTIRFDKNLSDCNETREITLGLKLSNASGATITLPNVIQDFISANGLVTPKGLQAFAEAVQNGEATTNWEQDGVVVVVQDIDMTGVSGWKGIGTAAKPFTGKFDGKGHSITNLKNTDSGLFGYCKGATIENITLGKGSSIYNNKEYAGKGGCLGGIVSVAESTTISGCGLAGEIEFDGSSDNDDTAYVGGIVGWADKDSRIRGSKLSGKVTVSTGSAFDTVCYEGGIAGLCLGSITECEVIGQVNYTSGIGTARIGGVQGGLSAGAQVDDNSFMGTVTLNGNASSVALGGLYGYLEDNISFDNATDSSISLGTIQLNSFYSSATATTVFAGGFAGLAAPGISLSFKGYTSETNILLDASTAVLAAKHVCVGGILGGCDLAKPAASLSFSGIQNTGSIKVKYDTSIACQVRRMWIGGVAGLVNGPAVFEGCSNKGEIGKPEDGLFCARSNGYNEIVGGIAGYAHGGDVRFDDCSNQANIYNSEYNNNGIAGVFDGMYTPSVTGGILGAFNFGTSPESFKLTMNSCTNFKEISAYRGYTGGIVGYGLNAEIKSCSSQGRLDNGTNDLAAFRGSIAGAVGNATVTDCTANCDVHAKVYGSADHGSAGGIVGMAIGQESLTISDCSYYGIIKSEKMATDKPEYPGGILGFGNESTTIAGCRYGGTVQGVEISANNVSTPGNVIGNGIGTVSDITYWTGKQ